MNENSSDLDKNYSEKHRRWNKDGSCCLACREEGLEKGECKVCIIWILDIKN